MFVGSTHRKHNSHEKESTAAQESRLRLVHVESGDDGYGMALRMAAAASKLVHKVTEARLSIRLASASVLREDQVSC